VLCVEKQSLGSIEIRLSHDGEAGLALLNLNQSERLCFTHNMKITIIKSYYDTLMAKFMFIYVNLLVFSSPTAWLINTAFQTNRPQNSTKVL